MKYSERHHADTIGLLCERFQTQNWIIIGLVAVVGLLVCGLFTMISSKTIHVYEVQADGSSVYHGVLKEIDGTRPSAKEAEFVARKFSTFLLNRNSSTTRASLAELVEMASTSLQETIEDEWKLGEVAEKIEQESVRTEISWGNIHSTLDAGIYRVRIQGTQSFFPIERPRVRVLGEAVFDVEVSLRGRPREALSFPNGLEVIAFRVLRSEGVGEESS